MLSITIEWLTAIADAAPDYRARILGAMADCWGFTVQQAKPMTADEKLARLEQKLSTQLGAIGITLISEAYR